MDEILATIRRIISEDEQSSGSPGAAGPAGGSRSEAAPAGGGDADDVLELTDALNEDGSVRRLPPHPPSPADGMPEPASAASIAAESEAGREPELPPEAAASATSQPAERQEADDEPRLVSEVTSLAAAAAFARLASAPRQRREPPLVGDRALDEIVTDLLRPLLQTWLDEHLPEIVQRLVDAEIARASRRAGRE